MTNIGNIAAGDKHTAQAGAQLLALGGNAVDAAVGATYAAFAAEPVLTSPFGGGFAMLAGPHIAPVAYDFFADIPGRGLPAVHPSTPLDFEAVEVSFGPTTQVFHAGRGAAAWPLLLPGLLQMQAEHGVLSREQVLAPAIRLAQTGVALSSQVAGIANIIGPILTLTPATRQLFAPHGHVLKANDIFNSPQLAVFLQNIAAGLPIDDLCAPLLTTHAQPYGRLTYADMQAAKVIQRAPVMLQLGDYQIAFNPPPSLAGLLIAFGLQQLAQVAHDVWQDETASLQCLFACMQQTQHLRQTKIDPAVMQGSEALLAMGSTTHISVIDKYGMACAITSSNGEGCGHLIDSAGVMANNFLGEEDINPAGFHVRPAGERLTSMMCPTIVLKDGLPILAMGTGGSNRIRTALLQVLAHHLLGGKSLEEAIKMPRLHYEGGPLFMERSVFGKQLHPTTLAALSKHVAETVYFDAPNMFFGGVHVAARPNIGFGDPRRAGTVCT